jgi:hypothetical protein
MYKAQFLFIYNQPIHRKYISLSMDTKAMCIDQKKFIFIFAQSCKRKLDELINCSQKQVGLDLLGWYILSAWKLIFFIINIHEGNITSLSNVWSLNKWFF